MDERPPVGRSFWIGMAWAVAIEAAFVALGFAAFYCMRCAL